MVLTWTGLPCYSSSPLTLVSFYQQFPDALEQARKFARIPARHVDAQGVLYIRQKQDVVTFNGDKFSDTGHQIRAVGTQDVLTCHVLVLHHPEAAVMAMAHYDEYVTVSRLERLVRRFCQTVIDQTYYNVQEDDDCEWEWIDDNPEDPEDQQQLQQFQHLFDRIDLKLIGGYQEASGKGGILSQRILNFFADHQLHFRLSLCCLGPANTKDTSVCWPPEPKVGGVLARVADGRVIPATFGRSFVDSLPEQLRTSLLLGPSLIRKPQTLKQLILSREDGCFQRSNGVGGPQSLSIL